MIKELTLTIVTFLLIDIPFIQLFASRLYKQELPASILADKPNLISAVVFYIIFCVALWYLVISSHSNDFKETLLRALVFGVAAYSTFALTNLAVIQGWTLRLALLDILWGGLIAVIVTYIVLKVTLL